MVRKKEQDPFLNLLVEYVLDQHPEDVRLRIKAHLDSGCVACRTELQVLQETIHLLPLALPQKKVSPAVKTRIDRSVDAEQLRAGEQEKGLQRISHYRILRRIGIGGMGDVYLAEDTRLGRTAALKVIRAEVATNLEQKKRFLREARAAAVLSHPGIATIYEVGQEEGTDFIAMEYVEGRSLAQLMGKPLDPDRIVRLGIQLAAALCEAHEHGILHRDLKPENIQIGKDERVKILDFGLAKFMETRLEDDYTTTSDRILGTIPYMSPEQIQGAPLDKRSDLFSLGSILYEMASGRPPFTGENPGITIDNILNHDPPPLPSLNPRVPLTLQKIIQKCLQKDPKKRYAAAKELEADLTALQKGESVDVDKPSAESPAISIAVLYFENLSEEREDDYFRAGMTEDIIVELSKIRVWEVRPRSQVVPYKDRDVDPREIGLELKVTHILQGSIRKAGNRLRISAQLVNARNAASVWAERYDRDLKDVFEIQSEIAQKIASALQVHLTKAEKKEFKKRYTKNLEAYDFYLQGREGLFKLSKVGIDAAIEDFGKALEADPNYGLAYSGLALAHAIKLSFYGGSESLADQAIENANRAIYSDPNLPQAHAALGLAYFLKGMGSEAIASCEKAIRLNPYDAFATWILGRLLYRLNQYEDALRRFERTIELLPDFYTAYSDLAQAYENMGQKDMAHEMHRKAMEACRRYLNDFPDEARAHVFLANSYVPLGAHREAIEEGQTALQLSPEDPVMMYNLACLYSQLNEPEAALEWLEESIQHGRLDFEWLKRDPDLENARKHPAYLSLIARYENPS